MFKHHSFSAEEQEILKDIKTLYNFISKLQSDLNYLAQKAGVDLPECED